MDAAPIDDTEIWKPIPKFPEHEVSSHGRVRHKHTGYIVPQRMVEKRSIRYSYERPYYVFTICNMDGWNETIKTHRLVAELFIDNPEQWKYVQHIELDPANNRVSNLRWAKNTTSGWKGKKTSRMDMVRKFDTYYSDPALRLRLANTDPKKNYSIPVPKSYFATAFKKKQYPFDYYIRTPTDANYKGVYRCHSKTSSRVRWKSFFHHKYSESFDTPEEAALDWNRRKLFYFPNTPVSKLNLVRSFPRPPVSQSLGDGGQPQPDLSAVLRLGTPSRLVLRTEYFLYDADWILLLCVDGGSTTDLCEAPDARDG
jgi:hypothetical protein